MTDWKEKTASFKSQEKLWAIQRGKTSRAVSGKTSSKGNGGGLKTNRLAPGGTGANTAWMGADGAAGNEGASGTSIFDPVLCELIYRWFSPKGGTVLDPFAGGSVRGIVASKLGRQYIGVELRDEQVQENRKQADAMCADPIPVWKTGDSVDIATHAEGVEADLFFTCPPYADLEVYSDDQRDLSNMSYDQFLSCYRHIIKSSIALLKQDRFACIVVGEVRDKKGIYRNFIGHTVQAFIDAGAQFYNEAILVTAVGSLPIRAGRSFTAGRKMGKTHQNVLMFVKGDPKAAVKACGDIVIDDSAFDGAVSASEEL